MLLFHRSSEYKNIPDWTSNEPVVALTASTFIVAGSHTGSTGGKCPVTGQTSIYIVKGPKIHILSR